MPDDLADNLANDVNADVTAVAPECLHLDPATRKGRCFTAEKCQGAPRGYRADVGRPGGLLR